MKKFFTYAEAAGVLVLLLILVAFIRTPEFFTLTPSSMHADMYIMLGGIVLGGISATARILGYHTPYRYMVLLAIFLTISGGYIFFMVPEYLYTGVALPLSYWHQVSFLTLPAVCIEGGTMTLFLALLEHGMHMRTQREKVGMVTFFVMYSTFMISRSFLTLGHVISIENHIMTSRLMAGIVIFVTVYAILNRNNPSRRIW
jgi:hypothetical protein